MFTVKLDEIFKSDLGDKVVDAIERIGRPKRIDYDEYDTNITTHYTATLTYDDEKQEEIK